MQYIDILHLLPAVFNRLCGLVVQHADRQARGREFEPRRSSLFYCLWPWATYSFVVSATNVALGHQNICGSRPQLAQVTECLVAYGHNMMICGYRPHCDHLWLQATL